MQVRFQTLDVFTRARFGGNQLAVVLDAQGVSDAEMQAIAAEFNIAETTFLLPPENPANTARVRIFTPGAELPFAGHPNVGTAVAVARLGTLFGKPVPRERVCFEQLAGLVPLDITWEDGEPVAATLSAPRPFMLAELVPVAAVAASVGLPEAAVVIHQHAPVVAGCGTRFLFAALSDRATLAAAKPRTEVLEPLLRSTQTVGIHLHCPGAQPGLDCETRMFAPLHGIPEDPATGSANVALVGLYAACDPAADLDLSLAIGQGDDMGRPSRLAASATKRGGIVTETRIGGGAVPVMEGVLRLS